MDPLQVIGQFTDSVWWKVLSSTIATAAMLAAVTPNKWDNVIIQILRSILDSVALNVGNAKNQK